MFMITKRANLTQMMIVMKVMIITSGSRKLRLPLCHRLQRQERAAAAPTCSGDHHYCVFAFACASVCVCVCACVCAQTCSGDRHYCVCVCTFAKSKFACVCAPTCSSDHHYCVSVCVCAPTCSFNHIIVFVFLNVFVFVPQQSLVIVFLTQTHKNT